MAAQILLQPTGFPRTDESHDTGAALVSEPEEIDYALCGDPDVIAWQDFLSQCFKTNELASKF